MTDPHDLREAWPKRRLSDDEAEVLADAVVGRWKARDRGRVTARRAGGVALVVAAAALFLAVVAGAPDDTPVVPDLVVAPEPAAPPEVVLRDDRVEASAEARYALSGPRGDRVVALHDGRVRCTVQHRAAGERFRVVVGAAEVEVTGTTFTVIAEDDVLTSVRVVEGVVVVRPGDGTEVSLVAGQRWPAEVAAPSDDPPTETPPVDATPPAGPTAADRLRDGLDHLDAGRLAEAVEVLRPGDDAGVLHEDLAFWRAIARTRQGVPAADAWRAYLERHGRSPRAGVAHCRIGVEALEAGRIEAAREAFTQAATSKDTGARACGEAGIARLASR